MKSKWRILCGEVKHKYSQRIGAGKGGKQVGDSLWEVKHKFSQRIGAGKGGKQVVNSLWEIKNNRTL